MENEMISIREALDKRPHLYRLCDPENKSFQRIVTVTKFFYDVMTRTVESVVVVLDGEDTGAESLDMYDVDKPCLLPIPDEIFH